MSDIVERLRANAKSVDCLQDMDPDLLYAAADEIERLQAENAKFQLAIKRQADRCDALKDHAIDLTTQINTTPPSVPEMLPVPEDGINRWNGDSYDRGYADGWNHCVTKMLAPPSVPDGFVLVPIEPDIRMESAGADALEDGDLVSSLTSCARATYVAMLAAAPKPGEGE